MPLVVSPGPWALLFGEVAASLDAAPLRLTLSDGGTWRRSPGAPRWDLSAGLALGPLAAALAAGAGMVGVAVQVDALRRPERRIGLTAAARMTYGGGWDLSLVPACGAHAIAGRWGTLVVFGAARVRWGRTLYAVQGWDSAHASPYARAETVDLAVAPMAGIAAVWRFAEVRLTGGYEVLLVDRIVAEDRATALSRSGGPFATLAVRGRLGGDLR